MVKKSIVIVNPSLGRLRQRHANQSLACNLPKSTALILFLVGMNACGPMPIIDQDPRPAKVLTEQELQDATAKVCEPGKQLVPLTSARLQSDRFEDVIHRTKLIYFNKGKKRCALAQDYSTKPFLTIPTWPVLDREYTTIGIKNHCLENGVLFTIEYLGHYDSVCNSFRLHRFMTQQEPALFTYPQNIEFDERASLDEYKEEYLVASVYTYDSESLSRLHKDTGITFLGCEVVENSNSN
jgi:hypothetical protein